MTDGDCLTCDLWVPGDYAWLQDAVDAAGPGELVCVEPGTHVSNLTFPGVAFHLLGVAGPRFTLLDGAQQAPVAQFASGDGPDTVLEGFTLLHGTAYTGGGLRLNNSSPTLRDLIIRDNSTTGDGGGIYLRDSDATVSQAVVAGNQAAGQGGGLFVNNSTVELSSAIVVDNTASQGGGIRFNSGNVSLSRCDVFANSPNNYSGLSDPTGTDGNLSEDPVLQDLTDVDALHWDLHLSAFSPLIDRAPPRPVRSRQHSGGHRRVRRPRRRFLGPGPGRLPRVVAPGALRRGHVAGHGLRRPGRAVLPGGRLLTGARVTAAPRAVPGGCFPSR